MADCCSPSSSSSSSSCSPSSCVFLKQRLKHHHHHHHPQQHCHHLHRHHCFPRRPIKVSKLHVIMLVSFLLLSPQASVLVGGAACTSRDISISQSRMSSGIPEFIVQIFNTCTGACAPSQVHVNCGWFASAEMVNPLLFHRLAPNDCLVNAGRPLARDHIIRFTYQNSFMYPLSFKSAAFC